MPGGCVRCAKRVVDLVHAEVRRTPGSTAGRSVRSRLHVAPPGGALHARVAPAPRAPDRVRNRRAAMVGHLEVEPGRDAVLHGAVLRRSVPDGTAADSYPSPAVRRRAPSTFALAPHDARVRADRRDLRVEPGLLDPGAVERARDVDARRDVTAVDVQVRSPRASRACRSRMSERHTSTQRSSNVEVGRNRYQRSKLGYSGVRSMPVFA